jgi:hypothetical protein
MVRAVKQYGFVLEREGFLFGQRIAGVSGETMRNPWLDAPADVPISVTLSGFPPNAAMFVRIHLSLSLSTSCPGNGKKSSLATHTSPRNDGFPHDVALVLENEVLNVPAKTRAD